MLKFLILFAILGAALANHLGSNKWYIVTVYDGTSCQGTPIQVTARLQSCTLSTTTACVIDVVPFDKTSFTQVCVNRIRDYLPKVLPDNYVSELAFRKEEGKNCTDINGAYQLVFYPVGKCAPSPDTVADPTWRIYTECSAETMVSKRDCQAGCGTCANPVTRSGQNSTCYDINSTFNGIYNCNSFPQAILDVFAHASSLHPTMLLPYLVIFVLALAVGSW